MEKMSNIQKWKSFKREIIYFKSSDISIKKKQIFMEKKKKSTIEKCDS